MDDDEAAPDMLMAMPRRELYSVRGFVKDIAVGVISSLADESWFASAETLRADVDTKEVRVGVVVRLEDRLLVDDTGLALFVVPVTDEATRLGPGLRALKELARIVGESLVHADCHTVELRGYLNDDLNEELRPCVVMVYEVRCHEARDLDPGLDWLPLMEVGAEPLEEASAQVINELYGD